MKVMKLIAQLVVVCVLTFVTLLCGYVAGQYDKADRIYVQKEARVVYRDTCCSCSPK